jgi:uncharacterized protein
VKLSGFNIYVGDSPEPGSTLVYNTFSGGFAILDAATLATLRKADAGGTLSPEEQELVDPDFFDRDVGILVESRAAEEREFRAWFERRRSSTDKLDCIVSTTFACNFDCTYCCQSDVLNGKMMNATIGAQTAEWLANRALEIGATKIELAFVGGEPLLHPDRVEQILADIRARAPHVTIRFGLITNGYFLTRELVERWVPLGLRSAQVTLDGDETTHGHTRVSKKKGEDTFARIFANVLAVCDLIDVMVNGNYQTDTVHGFVPLIHKLRDAGFKPGSRVKFSPALAGLGAPTDAAINSCLWSGSSPELMIAINDESYRAGFDAGDPVSVGPCSFHERHHYAIDPDGHIYKCPGFLGKAEWAIGHVESGLGPRYESLAGVNPQRLCGSCVHRPDCAGGCVAAAWIEAGRTEGVNCEIGFYEKYRDTLVTRKYALAVAANPVEAAALFPPTDIEIPRAPGRRSSALRVIAAA